MHVVQFLLKMLHLPLDGGLLVTLLVFLLLGGIGLVGDARDLNILIQHFFDQLRPSGSAVFGENGVALLVGVRQQRGHDAGGHAERIHLIDKELRGLCPGKSLGEAVHLPKERPELFLPGGAVQVVILRAARGHQLHRVVGIDSHILQVHAVLRTDHGIPLLIQLRDAAAHTDGIKVVFRKLRIALVLFRNDEDHLFAHGNAARSRVAAKLIQREKYRGVRGQDHIISRDNYHFAFSFLTKRSFIIHHFFPCREGQGGY